MSNTRNAKGYVTWMLGAFLVTCLSAATINLVVDPYGLFGTPRISGFNAIKPAASDRVRFVKGYYADRANVRTIISGNSRPEMGLDPLSTCWRLDERPVFNTGIPGASLSQQIQLIEHAAQTSQLRRAFLGLDLVDFFVDPNAPSTRRSRGVQVSTAGPNLRVDAVGEANRVYQWRRIKDWLTGLFSLETLADSVATIAQQSVADLADRRPDGFNPARDYWPIIRHEGQAVLFDQKSAEVVRMFSAPGLAVYQGGRPWSSTFDALARFLVWAKANQIQITLFVNPYHADYLAAIKLTGSWDLLEDWKRGLVKVASKHGVTLWDFNAIDHRTAEAPPEAGDLKSSLVWFWEPAHYRREYGELMLASMLGRECSPEPAPKVGKILTPENIDSHLANQRQDVETYVSGNPSVRQRLRRSEL
jgi:hypothetical protein